MMTEEDIIREIEVLGKQYIDQCITHCTSTDRQVAFARVLYTCAKDLKEISE